MNTDPDRLQVVARSIRSSLVQLLAHVDELSALLERLPVEDSSKPRPREHTPGEIYVDQRDFTVHWSGKSCHLGHTLSFRLMAEFTARPNEYVAVRELLMDVWNGTRSPNAVRSAVNELRTRLSAGGMSALARCIDGHNPGFYGLMLPRR